MVSGSAHVSAWTNLEDGFITHRATDHAFPPPSKEQYLYCFSSCPSPLPGARRKMFYPLGRHCAVPEFNPQLPHDRHDRLHLASALGQWPVPRFPVPIHSDERPGRLVQHLAYSRRAHVGDVALMVVVFSRLIPRWAESHVARELPSIVESTDVSQLDEKRHRRQESNAIELRHPLGRPRVPVFPGQLLHFRIQDGPLCLQELELPQVASQHAPNVNPDRGAGLETLKPSHVLLGPGGFEFLRTLEFVDSQERPDPILHPSLALRQRQPPPDDLPLLPDPLFRDPNRRQFRTQLGVGNQDLPESLGVPKVGLPLAAEH